MESAQKCITIPLDGPDLKEKMFFFASEILGSVSLTLFIDQFADSFLASLPDFYATFFFSSYYRAFSGRVFQSFSALLSPWRNSQIRIHTRTSGWPRVWHIRLFTYVLVLGAPILSRLSGIVFHSASTSITAYGIATKRTTPFYLIAVGLHGSNNFFATLMHFSTLSTGQVGLWSIGAVFPLATALLFSNYLYGKVSEKNAAQLLA